MKTPPMPEGFTDQAAWEALHFKIERTSEGIFTEMSIAVMQWRKNYPMRMLAAMEAKAKQPEDEE